MINPKHSDIGRKVIYRAGHPTAVDEEGVLTSFNGSTAFVRYGSDHGAKGTNLSDLRWVNPKKEDLERLTGCAVRHKEDVYTGSGPAGHKRLKEARGIVELNGCEDGFYTNYERFVSRKDAVPIAVEAGQISKGWLTAKRELLSSDVDVW